MKKDILKVVTKNSDETMIFAEKLAKTIEKPLVVNLVGDLGAGKTTFAKGFLRGLGVCENVTSPTFTLLNEYYADFPIFHFDMYRIEDENETVQLGFDEYFDLNTLKGVTLVEWAENTPKLLPNKYMQIDIEKIDENKREFNLALVEN